MKVYHSTPIENKETVMDEGLYAMVTDKITLSDEQITAEGVFFFIDIESARGFGADCCGGEYAIFSAEVDESAFIFDPEYDGEAIFVESSFPTVALVEETN